MAWNMRWHTASLALVGVGLLAGCGDDEAPSPQTTSREGQAVDAALEGTDAWVAIAREGDLAVAYMCGGPATLETHTRWLAPRPSSDGLRFEGAGWTLTTDADVTSGTLTGPDGTVATLDPAPAVAEIAGLYTLDVDGCRGGVIVTNGGDAQGAFCNDEGILAQVTPIRPLELTTTGLPVEVTMPNAEVISLEAIPVDVAGVVESL